MLSNEKICFQNDEVINYFGYSAIDRDINEHYDANKYSIRLERDFMMNADDFLNLFAGVYIASERDKHDYYNNYFLVDIPPGEKDAIYLSFDIEKDGFLDFTIKQFDSNRKQFSNEKSRIGAQRDK